MGELDYQMALILQHKFEQESKNRNNSVDSDREVALLLQEEFQKEEVVNKPAMGLVYESKKKPNQNPSKCLTDPSWEVIDPTPDIHNLFLAFNDRFFWNKLLMVCVSWSKKMTSCAGICSYQGRGGLCSITLSEPLLKLRPRKDLVETLLHEMIHAFLFVTHNNKDRDGHGPEFHKHMYRINKEAGTNITVYHDFHDEVRLYKQHWWKCNGPCRNWKPFFGMVRRAMNRAPGPNDRWWAEHSRNCGGMFIKVKEPDNYNKKGGKSAKQLKETKKPLPDIRNYTSSKKSESGNQTLDKVKTLENCNSNAKVINVIPSKTSNIYGFTNLDKPSTSGGVIQDKSNINGFRKNVKGAVSNKSGTIVINKTGSFIGKPKSTTSSKVINVDDDSPKECETQMDYSTVRNHWVNKFENKNVEKRSNSSNNLPSKVPRLTNESPKRTFSENTDQYVNCPICDDKFTINNINSHVDTCLKGNFGEKYFTNETTNPSTSVTGKCTFCNIEIQFNDYDEHTKDCRSAYKNITSNHNHKLCPVCEEILSPNMYDTHVEKCLLNICDNMESKYNTSDTEYINCLACDKKLLKSELDSHLEDCMSMSNIFDDSNTPEPEDSDDVFVIESDNPVVRYNCPCCMELIDEKEMNTHIDLCLNITGSSNRDRDMLLQSMDDDD